MLAQQLVNGLSTGSIYVLFALGFTLVFGVHHILNLAHGAVFMWGSLIGLYCVTYLNLPFPLVLLTAGIGAGILSVVLDYVAFRPLRRRNAPEFSAIVVSIGAGFILMNVAQRVTETQVLRYPFGTFPIGAFRFLGVRLTYLQVMMLVAMLVLLGILLFFLHRTRFGRQIRAVAVNEKTAGLMGINSGFVYAQTFFISGVLAGIAGVLIGIAFNSVHFLMGEPYMLKAFVVIVLGGLGSVMGAVIAGLALGVIQTLTVAYVSTGLIDTIIFTLLFAMLLLKPTGLFGNLRLEKRVARS